MITTANLYFDKSMEGLPQWNGFEKMYSVLGSGVESSLKFFLRYAGDIFEHLEPQKDDHHFIPILMILDFAEAIDGASILLRKGCTANCIPLMRQALELRLNLKYITQDKASYNQRCLAYEYWHWKDELRLAKVLMNTKDISRMEECLKWDRYDEVRTEISQLEKGRVKAIEVRRGKVNSDTKKHCRVKTWYELWSGPGSAEELAARIGDSREYAFYRTASRHIHGAAAAKRLFRTKPALPRRLRTPIELYGCANFILDLCFTLGLHLVKFYIPERERDAGTYIQRNVLIHKPKMDKYKDMP